MTIKNLYITKSHKIRSYWYRYRYRYSCCYLSISFKWGQVDPRNSRRHKKLILEQQQSQPQQKTFFD